MAGSTIIQDLIHTQLFHLISMLICIGVVVWLFLRHFFAQSRDTDADKKLRQINTLYISGILVFIIIELVTAICMENARHADILSFVSFASTISSLILSVIAIIFTIVSTRRGEEQYKKIDIASDKVTESLSRFSEKTTAIDSSVTSFKSLSDTLIENLSEVLNEVREMKVATYEIKDKVSSQIQGSIDKGEERLKDNEYLDLIQRFVSVGSFSGNLALYACLLSKDKNQPFKIGDITANNEDVSYKFGYLIASCSIGIITGKITPEACVIQDYYKGLGDMLEKSIMDFINKSDPSFKPNNQDAFDRVKKLFNI